VTYFRVFAWLAGALPLGAADSSGADGQIAMAAQQGCSCYVFDEDQGKLIVPTYAGPAPGMPGIVQVNFPVTDKRE
jgi:hypothetical protein